MSDTAHASAIIEAPTAAVPAVVTVAAPTIAEYNALEARILKLETAMTTVDAVLTNERRGRNISP